MTNVEKITMYGTSWCIDCHRARRIFKNNKVDYIYIDLDKNAHYKDLVIEINGGNQVVPTIIFPDGDTLSEPSNQELLEKFERLGILNA